MEPRCPSCGYNLTGLPENRCPECGRRFTREELESPKYPHVLVVILVAVTVLAGLPAVFVAAWAGVAFIDVQRNIAQSAFPGFFYLVTQVAFALSGIMLERYIVRFGGPSTPVRALGLVIVICVCAWVLQDIVWTVLTMMAGRNWGFPILD